MRNWLAAHPRFQLHFTPTSASWLNSVESWFSKLTQQRLRRGVFCSVQELVVAIKDYLRQHNADPKPFVWSTTVDTILDKKSRSVKSFSGHTTREELGLGCRRRQRGWRRREFGGLRRGPVGWRERQRWRASCSGIR